MKPLKTIPILFVLFISFIASNSFADKPSKYDYYVDVPVSLLIECANDGNGEYVSGVVSYRIMEFYSDDKYQGHATTQGGVLEGETTGEIYHVVGIGAEHFNSPSAANLTIVYTDHWVGDKGTQLKVITKIHLTFNANGELTTVFDNSFSECK